MKYAMTLTCFIFRAPCGFKCSAFLSVTLLCEMAVESTHDVYLSQPTPTTLFSHSMSDLNINILVQSIENLSQQVAKSETATKQDKASLAKAQALLEGLKGMFGIQAITMEAVGDMIAVIATMFDNNVQFILNPSQQLKLCDVKVITEYCHIRLCNIPP